MSKFIFFTNAIDQTVHLGEEIGKRLPCGTVVVLRGDIGAGKTCLARGLCIGAGMDDKALFSSPSFTIMNCYPSHGTPLYHCDLYRLKSSEDIEDIGFWDWINGEAIVVIEWPDLVLKELSESYLLIEIAFGVGAEERWISVESNTEPMVSLLKDIAYARVGD